MTKHRPSIEPSAAAWHAESNTSAAGSGTLSADLYRRFFASANIGLAVIPADMTWAHVNPRLCDMLGFSETELTRRSWLELTHPEDLETDLAQFRRLVAGDIEHYQIEKRFRRKDGSFLHGHQTLAAERDPGGRLAHAFFTLSDRVGEEATRSALLLSEQRFRLLTESTLDGVWDWDIAAGTLWLSPSWKAQLGYRDEELANAFETWEQLIDPEDHDRVMAHLQAFLAAPAPIWQETFRLAHHDGGWRQILARAILVFGPRGEAARMVGVHVDITAEREAIAELRALSTDLERILRTRTDELACANAALEKEKLFTEAVLNTAPAVVVVLAPDATVMSINPFVERLLGWKPDELIGRDWIDICVPSVERRTIRALFEDALTQQRPVDYERPVLTKDGGTRYLSWYGEVLHREPAQPPYLVAVGIDVTEQRRTQQALNDAKFLLEQKVRERTHQLEVAQAAVVQSAKLSALGTLVAGISHEINNPLMGLLNYVGFARRQSDGPVAEVLDKADRELKRIAAIVTNLLDYARPASSALGAVDLLVALRRALALVEPDLEGHHIRVDDQLPESLPAVIGDSDTLQQVLLNLLINARDALNEHEPRAIILRASCESAQVWLEVEDTGPGIPPAARRRIFDPFFTTKAAGKGTGLGLSVSEAIVTGLGGTLRMVKTGPDGTTFRITLPTARESPPRSA